MFKPASGLAAIPLRDIAPDPVINCGTETPASPSIATFPIASDCATFNNEMSLGRLLRGVFLPPLRLAMIRLFDHLGYQVEEL